MYLENEYVCKCSWQRIFEKVYALFYLFTYLFIYLFMFLDNDFKILIINKLLHYKNNIKHFLLGPYLLTLKGNTLRGALLADITCRFIAKARFRFINFLMKYSDCRE